MKIPETEKTRECPVCNTNFSVTSKTKKYCSTQCYKVSQGAVWRFTDNKGIDCPVCGTHFTRNSGVHKFCSDQCKGRWKYISGVETTESQYRKISGNWQRYFCRLMRRTSTRPLLTVQDLHEKLEEQQGKCALSGVELTCQLEQGKRFKTNASIDRLIPGGEYTKDNIQLVCAALNSWRGDTDLQEFIWFCRQVTEYQGGKE